MTGWIARVALAVGLLLAGACDGGGDAAQPPSSTTLASAGVDTVPPETEPPPTEPPTTGAPATTATTEDEGPPVVLRGDGLGAHRFGSPVDEVIAGLTLRWAPPDADSGWVAAGSSPFGVCPGTEVRVVEWRGFRVYFSDGLTPWGTGRRHFFSWDYLAADFDSPRPDAGGNRPPLHTDPGITVASSVADLQSAYGERLELFDREEGGGPAFGVQTPDGGLFGFVTTVEPGGLVRSIIGGGGCGE
ncbi:MAG: hypothetical protein ACRDZ7_18875 [Acidimicrobiia bacterium]